VAYSDNFDEEALMMPIKGEVFAALEGQGVGTSSLSASPEISIEDDRAIVMDLMRASQLTLAPIIEKEADIYTIADLKVRFR